MDKKDKEENFIKENSIIFKKYRVKKKLAEGAFGDVYMGSCIENNELVAIKVENRKILKPLLETEAFFLYSLRGLGIPEVLSFGRLKNYNVLVEPLLDKSLFDIFNEKRKRLALEDICLIAKQVIERIQWVHSKNIVHRDIKPDNFLIGKKDPNVIYLIDFGLSKKYKSSTTGKHIRFGFTGKLTGTVRFASANALRGGEQSRRDDLESIGYMIIFFMRGKLPWQGVTGVKKMERYLKIYKMKKNVSPEDLCKSLPRHMTEYMKYVKSLEFEQEPNYKYLRNLFTSLLKKIHDTNDLLFFSWIKLADMPNLKNPINPATRRDSPQSRLYRKIETKLKHDRNTSSDNDSNQKSFQTCTTQINNINTNVKNEDNNKDGIDSDFVFKTKKEKSKDGLNTMVTNLNQTIDENIVDFGDEEKNKVSSIEGPVNIKNNTEKKKNNTVNDVLDFKNERKNRQNQQNFTSCSISVKKKDVVIKDKSEEIKFNTNKENNLVLIDIKGKMENKVKNNKIIPIKKEIIKNQNEIEKNISDNNLININNNIEIIEKGKSDKIIPIPKDGDNYNNSDNNLFNIPKDGKNYNNNDNNLIKIPIDGGIANNNDNNLKNIINNKEIMINYKKEKIINIPKDGDNINNNSSNSDTNIIQIDKEKSHEKIKQNININKNNRNQKMINYNQIESIDIPKNIQKKKNNILNNNEIYTKKEKNINGLQIKDILRNRNNNNFKKERENRTNEKQLKNIIIKEDGPIDNNRNKKKKNNNNNQIHLVNSSKNIRDCNKNIKISNKIINTDINILTNNCNKISSNKKFKNNNLTYEKLNSTNNIQNKNRIMDLELLPKNSDEINNEKQVILINNDINKNKNNNNNNLDKIQNYFNGDKNNLNDNIINKKKIYNSVNVFQNSMNINNNLYNNNNIILINNNLNSSIKNNPKTINNINNNNINEKMNNDIFINNNNQTNLVHNNNNIIMNNIEFNNNRQIRIVNRNRNQNRINNKNENINHSPKEMKNAEYINNITNKLMKRKSHGININNNNIIINNNISNNNTIYDPNQTQNASTLRNNSKSNDYQRIDTTNYILNKRPSHNVNNVNRNMNNMIYTLNNFNQIEINKRPSHKIKTNNFPNYAQIGINKRPSCEANINVSNFLNGSNIPIGYRKIKKITNRNNQLINKIGVNNGLDLRKNFQLSANNFMSQNNTYDNIRNMNMNMNNTLVNQFNMQNNNNNNMGINEFHELQNNGQQEIFSSSLNQNFRSNAIIGKTNNIPNFQQYSPNQANNNMQFYGYRNI